MSYGNDDVPLSCYECDMGSEYRCSGIAPMIEHLLNKHDYTPEQAMDRTEGWAETVYKEEVQWEYDHAKDMKAQGGKDL